MSVLRLRRAGCASALMLVLQGCIVVPQTREVYDADCRTMTKEIVLETAVVGRFQGCAGDACVAMLVATGAITAASAVVSGSIALVGNVAYWIERQGRCLR
jgi:chaperone required for assembly of F1-ATPase